MDWCIVFGFTDDYLSAVDQAVLTDPGLVRTTVDRAAGELTEIGVGIMSESEVDRLRRDRDRLAAYGVLAFQLSVGDRTDSGIQRAIEHIVGLLGRPGPAVDPELAAALAKHDAKEGK